MGVEQNLVSLCYKCHARLHSGEKQIEDFCEEYLKTLYPNWTEESVIYRKDK